MAKTRRSPDGVYASTGAVAQTGGKLPIYICNECEREVVWVESTKTGRKYLANVARGENGHRFYIGANLHVCRDRIVLGVADDERDADHEAEYDDWTAAHFEQDAYLRGMGDDEGADEIRELLRERIDFDANRALADERVRYAYIAGAGR